MLASTKAPNSRSVAHTKIRARAHKNIFTHTHPNTL